MRMREGLGEMTTGDLIHQTEVMTCDCGHTAQVHHGVDPVDGCLIVGLPSSQGWCDCALTATQVMARALGSVPSTGEGNDGDD